MFSTSNSGLPADQTRKNKTKITRRPHKKSRVGCPQCKQRKVKCDEALPSCKNCRLKAIRCGYYDYTPKQIEAVLLAHWEAAGSDPLQNPIPDQQIQPWKQTQVVYAHNDQEIRQKQQQKQQQVAQLPVQQIFHHNQYQNQPKERHDDVPSRPLQQKELVRGSYHNPESNETIPELTPEDNSSTFSMNYIENVKTNDSDIGPSDVHFVEYWTHRYSSSHIDPQVIDHSKLLRFDSPVPYTYVKPAKDDLENLEIPLVPHRFNRPGIQNFKAYKPYFNEPISGVISRIFILAKTFGEIEEAMAENSLIFHSLQLHGSGVFLSKYPDLDVYFLRYRGHCMNFILKELPGMHDGNVLTLLTGISLLTVSSFFLEGDGTSSVPDNDSNLNYRGFFSLASGPGSLLRTVYENPSKFPKSLGVVKSYGDALLVTTRYVWFPPYNNRALFELLEVLREFGASYMNDNHVDEEVIEQYENMIEFIEDCLDLLENEKSSDEVVRYPIGKLYDLFQKWYAIVPSEMFSLGSKTPGVEKVFYVFWFTLLQILDVIFVGCRYIFSVSFDGYYFIDPFHKEQMLDGLEDEKLIWYLNYSCRVISFFVRRKSYILRNTVLNDPLPSFMDTKDRLKARPIDIHERWITNFRDTLIKKINYPAESNVRNFDVNGNYYDSSNAVDEGTGLGAMFEGVEGLSGLDSIEYTRYFTDMLTENGPDDVDLLKGVNPETSLLYKDYDPRFTDPIFNERIVFQQADLDFIDKYIEDRRLILQLEAD